MTASGAGSGQPAKGVRLSSKSIHRDGRTSGQGTCGGYCQAESHPLMISQRSCSGARCSHAHRSLRASLLKALRFGYSPGRATPRGAARSRRQSAPYVGRPACERLLGQLSELRESPFRPTSQHVLTALRVTLLGARSPGLSRLSTFVTSSRTRIQFSARSSICRSIPSTTMLLRASGRSCCRESSCTRRSRSPSPWLTLSDTRSESRTEVAM